jgi:hypothetical protein
MPVDGRRHGELVVEHDVERLAGHKAQPLLPVRLYQPHERRVPAINLKRARPHLKLSRIGRVGTHFKSKG